jgi:intracellular sulfur oxidation DsrE/DsrF family protein
MSGRTFAVLFLITASCTGTPPARVPSASQPVDTASTPASGPGAEEPFVRTCESSVFGELRRWRDSSILAGPLAFVGARGYADEPARFHIQPNGRWSGRKVLIRITGETPVTVEVVPAARAFAGLLYDPASFNTHKPGLMQTAVRFQPCPTQSATQFNGAFLVDGVSCVPVTVTVEGRESRERVLRFGPCSS